MQLSLINGVRRALTLAIVTALPVVTALAAEAPKATTPAPPAPRAANGKLYISGVPGQKPGLWIAAGTANIGAFDEKKIAFKPWAKGLFEARKVQNLEPHTRCKPSGGFRQFLTPYGVEILEMPELKQILIFDVGGPHTWRTIYMDGRAHPADLEPSYYGHSVGHWEADTLVIDTVGYNTGFWFDRTGLPYTEAVHTTEYLTRRDLNSMDYRFVMTDPQTYDAPVEGRINLRWGAEEELFEYVCQQSNLAPELMVDKKNLNSIGKSSRIIP